MTLPYRVEAANHWGITVSSLEKSLDFFVGVLGFAPGATVDLDESFSAGITGVENAVIRVAFVEGPGVTIELVQYLAPARLVTQHRSPSEVGSAHLAFFVDDIDAIVLAAAPSGFSLAGTVQNIRVGPRAGGRAAYLRDADGTTLELVQRAPNPRIIQNP